MVEDGWKMFICYYDEVVLLERLSIIFVLQAAYIIMPSSGASETPVPVP
jgi:hypothetical protein